jgi:hypothetical protein
MLLTTYLLFWIFATPFSRSPCALRVSAEPWWVGPHPSVPHPGPRPTHPLLLPESSSNSKHPSHCRQPWRILPQGNRETRSHGAPQKLGQRPSQPCLDPPRAWAAFRLRSVYLRSPLCFFVFVFFFASISFERRIHPNLLKAIQFPYCEEQSTSGNQETS